MPSPAAVHRPRAVRRLAFLCAILIPAGSSPLVAQATDSIDMRQLGQRGVIFEAPLLAPIAVETGGSIGDVNGDGFGDVFLSVRGSTGRFYMVVYGRAGLSGRHTLLPGFPDSAVFRSAVETSMSRAAIDSAGDLNEDGFGDFLFSIPSFPAGEGGRGRVYLVYGSPGLKGDVLVDDIGGTIPGAVFFSSDSNHGWIGPLKGLALLGDINGDGQPDLAIGAPSSRIEGRNEPDTPLFPGFPHLHGMVFVLLDVRNLPAFVDLAEVGKTLPGMVILSDYEDEFPYAFLGITIEPLGDFDGDALDDFLVEASEIHRAYLIRGRRDLPKVLDLFDLRSGPLEGVTEIGDAPGGRLLADFAGVGDLNGDGLGELLLGLTTSTSSGGPNGVAALIPGGTALPARLEIEKLPLPGVSMISGTHPWFGLAVAGAGDLNGDGAGDLLLGSPEELGGVGRAYAIFGGADFPDELRVSQPFEGIEMRGEEAWDWFGWVVGPAGDFNGDGAGDMLVVARRGISTDTFPAKAYVIYGTGSGPPPLTLWSLTPGFGPLRGGTRVVLRGSGFEGEPEVRFGSRRATSVVLVSGSELQVTTPPGLGLGTADVSVSVGGETRVLGGAFEYVPNLPEIDLEDLGIRGFILEGDTEQTLGKSVAFGDLTGDGVAELISGNQTTGSWSVSIVRGARDLPPTLAGFQSSERVTVVTSSFPLRRHLEAVSVLGDVSDDGIVDLGIGLEDAGYVLFGREDLPREIDVDEGALFGEAVRIERGDATGHVVFAGVRDVTGDGIDDVAVGFPGALPGGEVVWFAGRRSWPEGLDLAAGAGVEGWLGTAGGEGLGDQLLPAGDVNGDGTGDLLVTSTSGPPGRSYLLFGAPEPPWVRDIDLHVEGGGGVVIDLAGALANLSWFNATAPGDVNGDGFADLLFGDEGGLDHRGISYLVLGSAELPSRVTIEESPAEPDAVVRIVREGAAVQAARVGPAGDFNSDGFADFLVGVPGGDDPLREPGHINVVFGRDSLPGRLELSTLHAGGLRIDGRKVLGALSVPGDTTGDLNGDGRPDFAFKQHRGPAEIPEPGEEGELRPGYVYVIFGLAANVPFIRGDANFDGRPDLSDAVATLRYLFASGPVPRCLDGADADDRGTLELTDGVFLLNHLFRSGRPPPAPFPEVGEDPTDDTFDCKGF